MDSAELKRRIEIARRMLENEMNEGDDLTTLGELEIPHWGDGVPVKFVGCRVGFSEPLIFRGTAISRAMDGSGDVLVALNGGGFADLPGMTPCLKMPFETWRRPDEDFDEDA